MKEEQAKLNPSYDITLSPEKRLADFLGKYFVGLNGATAPNDRHKQEIIDYISEHVLPDVCEKARWESPCSDSTHPSFWKTVVTSFQWAAWQKEQARRFSLLNIHQACNDGVYDMSEVEECGYISQEHFQEFLSFIEKNNTAIREAEICANGTLANH